MSKVTDMELINDQITELALRLWHISPVKTILDYTGMIGMIPADSPGTLTGNCFGIL